MTCRADEELDHASRILEDLPHGRMGTLAILGNHDYSETWRLTRLADALMPAR